MRNPLASTSKSAIQSQISTGIDSLDALLCDGITLGSLIMLHEDFPHSSSNISSMILKCIAAEGALSQQMVVEVAFEESFQKSLPGVRDRSSLSMMSEGPSDMNIAWRYKHLQTVDVEAKPSTSRVFDFGRKTDLSKTNASYMYIDAFITNLRDQLRAKAEEAKSTNTILRVVIRSLGSPLWTTKDLPDFLVFLTDLCVQFHSNMVCVFSMPVSLVDSSIVAMAESLADAVISLEAIADPADAQRVGYEAFVRIIKPIRKSDSVMLSVSHTATLAVKLSRRSLVFEAYNPPPTLDLFQPTSTQPQNSIDF